MTSNQHVPYVQGYTDATMVSTMGCQAARRSESHQNLPQFRLQAGTRLHEVGITSNRVSAWRGEYVLGSCTHRLSGHGSCSCSKSNICWPKVRVTTGLKS